MYENALNRSNNQQKLHYSEHKEQERKSSQKRSRNMIWFNPPFGKNVKSNIGKHFLHLIETYFPTSSIFQKLFNRCTVKISYCCMKNIKNAISSHNTKILAFTTTSPSTLSSKWNVQLQNEDWMPFKRWMSEQKHRVSSRSNCRRQWRNKALHWHYYKSV